MSINIRKVTMTDVENIKFLMDKLRENQMSIEEIKKRIEFVKNNENNDLFLYEKNGIVYGLLGFRIKENIEEIEKYGEITIVIVDPAMKNKGVGPKMLAYAENLAREKKCVGMWAISGTTRKEAHKILQKLGYEITGYRFVKNF